MSKLTTIISYEYHTDVKTKSFWIVSVLMPLLLIGFGVFVGFLAADSNTLSSMTSSGSGQDDLSGAQIAGMLCGMFLALFLMIFGSMIFNKVKQEKTNRIAEILASCVPGRTLITAKIISVGLLGMTQIMVWLLMLGGGLIVLLLMLSVSGAALGSFSLNVIWYILCTLLYFIGGYVLYGSLYAMCGAVTDKNGENQEYMTLITFLLLGSFYIGMYSIDNPGSALTLWCSYIPFTSPTIGVCGAISGTMNWWQTLLSLTVLYAGAGVCLVLAGKMYSSAMLLMGKKLGFKDFVTFFRSK